MPWLWLVGTPLTFLLLTTGLIGSERLRRASRVIDDGPIADAAARLLHTLQIGRRVTVAVCERIAAPVLIGIAEEEGLRGPHLRLFEAIGRVHEQVLGRRLPLNGAGVCGAALADLGLPVELLRGFALLARAAGLLGQIAEERRRPIGMDAYLTVDRNAVYVDPADDPAH